MVLKVILLGIRQYFLWVSTIANVTTSILGADFLVNFNLSFNIDSQSLADNLTELPVRGMYLHTS